ncbi:hypothetical protein Droror1_Dr00006861 [Drosera rotundifolia]
MFNVARCFSLGKFLDLSFSDHDAEAGSPICGHSIYRECLGFFGCGRMISCFRYATIDFYSIVYPSHKLELNYDKLERIQEPKKTRKLNGVETEKEGSKSSNRVPLFGSKNSTEHGLYPRVFFCRRWSAWESEMIRSLSIMQ